jgi:hypothetical protein
MVDPCTRLDRLITEFLERRIPFSEFQKQYSHSYADEEADRDFDSRDVEFYGGVHERAEWTTNGPSAQDRADGWEDENQFFDWLRAAAAPRKP